MDVNKSSFSFLTGSAHTGRIFLFIGAFLLCCCAAQITAGVLAAPTVVFLSDKNRTGRVNLENPSNKPKEIEVYFSFGLPMSDSLGNIHLVLQDSNVVDSRSAVDWIRAFPRKVYLPPNGSQVVRLVAHPPKDLPDGEYWARIVIRSQEGETALPVASEGEQITTKLNMIMQTALALKYRTGECYARLELAGMHVTMPDETNVEVMVDLKNAGNVSYLGVLTCRLLDADNRVINTNEGNLAVYRDLKKRIDLAVTECDYKKPYSVELFITSEGRTDIDRRNIIIGNEITYSAVVE